ncbi:DNA polymerase III, alpha subunit [Solidesulfovibrio fructosivorans JJ]]|uniref:DNA polymerase III subunit alpha n=1 Tax=Solidesulfovibrio fructosivorans JJ] TaxID=596151 RepID=E1JZS0_SOLFR|nr:DNA polymerase III subunit alpha [Solidesulfovibrio fructosivorans]EFL50100.1 DNA polymerase III, alpha subunit [Solidesulfovibrio fructosivorans JJ]]
MSDFVHLHCHTEYSLLDGAIRIGDLVKTAKGFGCPAAAITDHGNLHGALMFYDYAKKADLKPIIGCEVYVAKEDRRKKDARSPRDAGYHLVLLAKDMTGYHNLLKLVSKGHLEGFHYKPRVDKELLGQYGEGLIALSACLKGEINQKLLRESRDAAVATAREYAALFPDRFYLEIQDNGIPEQTTVNNFLIELSDDLKLPLVATNDCHYLHADDAEAHDILLCIQTAACVDDVKRMRFTSNDLYYRSPEEMAEAFKDVPQALANTCEIADRIDVKLDFDGYHFPVYKAPPGKSLDDVMSDMAREGLKKRLAKMPEADPKQYWERLELELGVITKMGFPGYFLIVQDFINWAKDHDIPVGPGRGSAAGSLVAYSLRITNLDPMPYDLFFERFLNIERVSMPDIDVDFCERRRHEVIRYVTEHYGADAVAQITTFGTMKAKGVVRDVGRALGMTFGETDRIAKLIPEDLKMTIDKALELEPELKTLVRTDPRIAHLIDISRRLEGLARHASTHAAGVVVSDKAMTEYVPLYKGKNNETVTQWDMKRVEKSGLVKFDFLGLKTITVIDDALKIIREMGEEPPDFETLPMTDPATYELFARGDTDGIFQVESQGMRKYLRMLKPNCFEDLIAMLALYRPGPLGSGMVELFIRRKHGLDPVEYPHPLLEETLRSTYGVIVYQEQVMKIAQVLANYSLGGGDLLRRAMGKKNAEEMSRQRGIFVEGCAQNKIDAKKANEIFDLMEKFAEYGFNKSHSAAYAQISYQTAYLKAHYPVAFMAALMTSDMENQDKLLQYIAACRAGDIELCPPDVNAGLPHFSVKDNKILYGLAAVKNIGRDAVLEIAAEREKDGPFSSLLDLTSRVNMRKVTKRVIEYLIKCGACDGFGCTRAGLFAGLDQAAAVGQRRAAEKSEGRLSLMELVPDKPKPTVGLGLSCPEAELPEWLHEEMMAYEKEALGFYLTSHPLLAYERDLRSMRVTTLSQCAGLEPGVEVKVPCICVTTKEIITKKGQKMAFCKLEDHLGGEAEVVVFSDCYALCRENLAADAPLFITAKIGQTEQTEGEAKPLIKLQAVRIDPLSKIIGGSDEPVEIFVACPEEKPVPLDPLGDILRRYPGQCSVHLVLSLPKAVCRLRLGPGYGVRRCPELRRELDDFEHGMVPARPAAVR